MIEQKHIVEHYEKRAGGEGITHIERLIPPTFLKDHVKMYAKVTLDVHASLGYHPHIGDREAYYIIQGEALYNDNGIESEIGVGACTLCEDGESHSIKNIGTEELVFMAIILKD